MKLRRAPERAEFADQDSAGGPGVVASDCEFCQEDRVKVTDSKIFFAICFLLGALLMSAMRYEFWLHDPDKAEVALLWAVILVLVRIMTKLEK